MHGFFFDLTILLVLASITSILFRFLKQPPILAYILTGIVAGSYLILNDGNRSDFRSLSEIGITLLLFILGIEMKIGNLRSVGKVAIITGIGQILFTTIFGFLIGLILGFDSITSIFVAFAITFSSTIVIVKLLSDKKDINSLYGKISVGFLLVQDFCAIIALIVLTSFSTGTGFDLIGIATILLKAVFLFAVTILMGKFIFPFLVHYLSRSPEILFIASLAWAFGLAALISSPLIGFSIEIGGFLAGLALANSLETSQIITKVRSLRDFFIVIFFIILGSGMVINNWETILIPGIILSLFILIGNPLIVLILLGIMGYTSRTGFLAGLTVAQISEFSLILVFLGQRVGLLSQDTVTIVTFVGIVTFTASTYMILYGDRIYKFLKPLLVFFERKKKIESRYRSEKELKDHIVLIGADRMGMKFLESIKSDNLLVIDFNPDIIKTLNEKGYNTIFGDISDTEIQEMGELDKASLIFSTVPDYSDNVILLNSLKRLKIKGEIIVSAHSDRDREDLLNAGADYVVMPYTISADFIANAVNKNKLNLLS